MLTTPASPRYNGGRLDAVTGCTAGVGELCLPTTRRRTNPGKGRCELETKKCSKCGEERSLKDFSPDKRQRSGLQSQCKECQRDYREANLEKVREANRGWARANPERSRANSRRWREANPEGVKEYRRRYRDAHREGLIEYGRQWHEENPDYDLKWHAANPGKRREYNNRRRALKAGNGGSHTAADERALFEKWSYCLCCGSTERLEIDHIVPLDWGGSNDVENLQVLCKPCNSSKSNRHATDYRPSEGGNNANEESQWNLLALGVKKPSLSSPVAVTDCSAETAGTC